MEALENATKEVVMTVAVTAGAASNMIKVISSSAEEVMVAITDELVDLIRLIARLPKNTAIGMSLFMRALVDRAAVLGFVSFTILYVGLLFYDNGRAVETVSRGPQPVVQEPESTVKTAPLEGGPCDDVNEYCPLCECSTSPSCRYCPMCHSRLAPVFMRPRVDKPKLAAAWWFCRKLWFTLGGFILEGNVAISQEVSRGFLLREDDDWHISYAERL